MTTNTATAPAPTRTLVAQGESKKEVLGVRYGFSLFAVGDHFEGVMHTRIYDGIKVDSKWDSQPVRLDATDKDAAQSEIRSRVGAMMRAMAGQDD